MRGYDAVWYTAAQFAGGALGVALAEFMIGPLIAHSAVRYAATVPGPYGHGTAFFAEAAISFALMMAILISSNDRRYTRLTPYLAASLVALWITFEAPLSGMSMNPARTTGSALGAQIWTGWWIYLTAPVLGMISAGFLYKSRRTVFCAKLHHYNNKRCIFRCNYEAL
jgi:aquaporin Z